MKATDTEKLMHQFAKDLQKIYDDAEYLRDIVWEIKHKELFNKVRGSLYDLTDKARTQAYYYTHKINNP